MKIAIIKGNWPALYETPDIEQQVLGQTVDIQEYKTIHPAEYKNVFQDLDGIIVRPGCPITREMVLCMKKIKAIISLGTGFDHICLESTQEKNIPVCNVRNYCTDEVADTTLAMLLAHHRKLNLYEHQKVWDW